MLTNGYNVLWQTRDLLLKLLLMNTLLDYGSERLHSNL
jgi:hypothetical protein